jgi:hypothetical protein
VDIEFEAIPLKPIHDESLTVTMIEPGPLMRYEGITVETPDVRGTVIFDRTQNAAFGLSGLLGFQVPLSVLTVSIATKIFRIGN